MYKPHMFKVHVVQLANRYQEPHIYIIVLYPLQYSTYILSGVVLLASSQLPILNPGLSSGTRWDINYARGAHH